MKIILKKKKKDLMTFKEDQRDTDGDHYAVWLL